MMPESSFVNLLVVVAIAFAVPLVLGFSPRIRLPAVVLEIVAGIAVGPSFFGWVDVDEPVAILSTVGLAFLLFLAGLEIDPQQVRGSVLRLAAVGFAVSILIAGVVGAGLGAAGLVDEPLLVAIILIATSLGVVVPVLKDADELVTPFGQLVVAAASFADFGAIILLSVFFSRDGAGISSQLVTVSLFAAALVVLGVTLAGAQSIRSISSVLVRLQDTSAQIRVRGAFLLLVALVALAGSLGLEVILGAFAAGLIVAVVDRDTMQTHPLLRAKLNGAGYGIFIPVFFVTSGVRFDAAALTESPATLAIVPIFLAALIAVRGLPALLYRPAIGSRHAVVAGLLQSTSLPFIVAASAIGVELDALSSETAAALVLAGLLSVVLFPLLGLALLRRTDLRGAESPGV